MKRFLLFLVVAIAVVSLGLTIYFFSTDNEVIYIKSSYLIVNTGDHILVGDENNQLLDFKNRSDKTTLSYSVFNETNSSQKSNIDSSTKTEENTTEGGQEVLVYQEKDKYFIAQVGGKSKIVVSTNNRSYSKLVIDVLVCDGSEEYPYIIRTENELERIGKEDEERYTIDKCYKLGNDIELTKNQDSDDTWTPIDTFEGIFDGNFFAINNMKIVSNTTNVGFVGTLDSGACIKNLLLTNLNFSGQFTNVGAFAGINKGVIQTSEAQGIIENKNDFGSYLGGVAGVISTSSDKAKIDRCGFDGTLTFTSSNCIAGGIAGQNKSGIISESYCRAVVENNNNEFGGIVYNNIDNGNLFDCYFFITDVKEEKTILKDKIFGIAYSCGAVKNSIMGCYFGGKINSGDISSCKSGSDALQKCGYLSSALSNDNNPDFVNKEKFITVEYSDDSVRYWNFDSVWEIQNDKQYPILNLYSSVGSTYILEKEISTDKKITTAQELYDVIKNNESGSVYKLGSDIDFKNAFVWGDNGHRIPSQFDGTIINPNGYAIKNLTIVQAESGYEDNDNTDNTSSERNHVGLVKYLGENAIIDGLKFENVTITYNVEDTIGTTEMVGVLAGVNEGAIVKNISISGLTVNKLKGNDFGGLFGYVKNYVGHGIYNVYVHDINQSGSYFVNAGGIAGENFGDIITQTKVYNNIYGLVLNGNSMGGVAGKNGGKILNTTVQSMKMNIERNKYTVSNIYSGEYSVYCGGIAGINHSISNGKIVKGSISNVYVSTSEITLTPSNNYKIYFGGIVGQNDNFVGYACVTNCKLIVDGYDSAYLGGIVGHNDNGFVSNCIVDKNTQLSSSIAPSLGASKDNIMNTKHCSIVGGIVGYDGNSSNIYSISKCACLANTIKGYYVGGISGIEKGIVEFSYCGDTTINYGGVGITGYVCGGLCGVISEGKITTSYAICSLTSATFGGKYKDASSVINMDVSSMGGLCVFAFNNAEVTGCYCVTKFIGNGVAYASCSENYSLCKIKNCLYQTPNISTTKTSFGTKITSDNLKGKDAYYTFKSGIGSTINWHTADGYPTLEGLDNKLPSSQLPSVYSY